MARRYIEVTDKEFEQRFGIIDALYRVSECKQSNSELVWFNARVEEMRFFGRYGRHTIWSIIDEVDGDVILGRGIRIGRRLGFIATQYSAPDPMIFRLRTIAKDVSQSERSENTGDDLGEFLLPPAVPPNLEQVSNREVIHQLARLNFRNAQLFATHRDLLAQTRELRTKLCKALSELTEAVQCSRRQAKRPAPASR
jgi:hypothetical protein